MKNSLGLLALLGILGVCVGLAPQGAEQNVDNEEKAIRRTIEHYFTGVAAHDVESMKKAFHADAVMFFVKEGSLQQVTQPEWHARMRSQPAGPEANYRKILSIDRAGQAASVKAIADFETFQFIDYISLLKIDGEWRIINKIFYRKEKQSD